MAHRMLIAAAAAMAALPLSAAQPELTPDRAVPIATAEPGPPRYCLYVGPVTGRLTETVECWTREMWADQGVDVDKEWARNGFWPGRRRS